MKLLALLVGGIMLAGAAQAAPSLPLLFARGATPEAQDAPPAHRLRDARLREGIGRGELMPEDAPGLRRFQRWRPAPDGSGDERRHPREPRHNRWRQQLDSQQGAEHD